GNVAESSGSVPDNSDLPWDDTMSSFPLNVTDDGVQTETGSSLPRRGRIFKLGKRDPVILQRLLSLCHQHNPQNSVQNCVASICRTFGRDIVNDIRALARTHNWPSQPIPDIESHIWKAAKIIRDDIEERINLGVANTFVGLLRLVTDWQNHHWTTVKKPRELSWIVTNIRVIDNKPEGAADEKVAWSVAKARFTLSADVAGPAMQKSAVSAKGGLSVEISWQDLTATNDVGDRLMQDLRDWIMHLVY
ncbi:hypothetical protein FPHYL_14203, partial [Fusarium phyllophilum]